MLVNGDSEAIRSPETPNTAPRGARILATTEGGQDPITCSSVVDL